MCEAESSGGRDGQNESFLVSWKIENFRFVDKLRESFCLKSPVFTMDFIGRTRWWIRLYSNRGFSKEAKEAGVFLHRSEDKYNGSISLRLIIRIIKEGNVLSTSDPTSFTFKKHENVVYGNSTIIKLNKILQKQVELSFDDDILIECKMWIEKNYLDVMKDKEECFRELENILNKHLFWFPSENIDLLTDIDLIERKFACAKNQCSIVTIINVEEKELDFTLERFDAWRKNETKVAIINHAFSKRFAFLILYLNNNDILQIKVLVNMTLTDYESVHCDLSVRCIDNVIGRISQGMLSLESNEYTSLFFQDVIKKSDILPAKEKLLDRDALNLHFVFTFARATHTIYAACSMSKVLQADAQENSLSRQMEDIFVSRKHCDVILRAGSQDVSCHKAIVCHMSPVLDAMLTADMQEKNTGVVHVPDVDPDTLNTLLRYMYTGGVNDMGVQECMKLFVASDKYQVPSLTHECRKMLEKNMSVDNVCEVLICADAHSDVTLKKSSIDFIRSNVSHVFSLDAWRSIAEENPKLASEVIMIVTSKLQKR